MEVCHIISAFARDDTRIFWKQCRSLVKSGYSVTLITNDGGESETREGVKIIPSGFKYSGRLHRILFARKINYRKALEVNADIFQIHDPEFIPLGLRLKRIGKHVVYDSHEDFPRQILEKDWIPGIFRKTISLLAEAYLFRSLKKFDAIFTVTPHIVENLSRSLKNVFLVTNYPVVEAIIKEFSFDEYQSRGNKLCYAGTVYRSSLQENIIKAIENKEEVEYIIIGTIDEKYKLELSEALLYRNVQFLNHVPKDILNHHYQNVTIGIAVFDYSPNLGYKTGSLGVNKIFEYMSFGLPVICTDFVLWKEIIDKYNCGICVNPNNIYEIRDAINYLVRNKSEAYQMGQNGRHAVMEQFNWSSQERVYLNILKQILHNHRL